MARLGPFGIWELLIILLVVLLIFGPRRLPEMAKGIGQSVREFRKGIRDVKSDIESDGDVARSNRQTPSETKSHTAEPVVSETAATKSS